MNASILKVHGSEVQEKNQPPHYVKQKRKHGKYESERFLSYLSKEKTIQSHVSVCLSIQFLHAVRERDARCSAHNT